ncbi:MAG: toll/interleukin-1 receptor domain-containing protein [Leucothrix sp.]
MADLYITYSMRERYWVSKLAMALASEGYSVWWDHAVVPGDNIRTDSQHALTETKCTLAVWSETAVDDHWVLLDAKQAKQQDTLISVLTRNGSVPAEYAAFDQADLSAWDLDDKQEVDFAHLLKAIAHYCSPSQLPADKKEQQTLERLARMRAEAEQKQQQREQREAQMVQKRLSV